MTTEDFTKEVELKISLGHLLAVWDVLSNRLAGSPFLETLSAEESRAMRALDDLCEHAIAANGIAPRPAPEWDRLIQAAKEHVKSIHLDFEDTWPQL
ncbi:MAG TPA: hypothetical protein VIY68_15360 [Steroidobacteraceae bacterium]